MREITVSWGSAAKIAWSIAWRMALFLVPAYLLGYAVLVVAMMAGDSLQGPVPWLVVAFYLLEALRLLAVVAGFLYAAKHVIGLRYSRSSFPRVAEDFRIALVTDRDKPPS